MAPRSRGPNRARVCDSNTPGPRFTDEGRVKLFLRHLQACPPRATLSMRIEKPVVGAEGLSPGTSAPSYLQVRLHGGPDRKSSRADPRLQAARAPGGRRLR